MDLRLAATRSVNYGRQPVARSHDSQEIRSSPVLGERGANDKEPVLPNARRAEDSTEKVVALQLPEDCAVKLQDAESQEPYSPPPVHNPRLAAFVNRNATRNRVTGDIANRLPRVEHALDVAAVVAGPMAIDYSVNCFTSVIS